LTDAFEDAANCRTVVGTVGDDHVRVICHDGAAEDDLFAICGCTAHCLSDAESLRKRESNGVMFLQNFRVRQRAGVVAIAWRLGGIVFWAISIIGERVGDVPAFVAWEP
jgi:hypothetical protein